MNFGLRDSISLFQKRTGVFSLLCGATDCHCHILPGVDDGVSVLEDSLLILDEYEKAGITSVFLTPHVMEDIPNTPEGLKNVYENLKSAYSGPIVLNLASENMLDALFESRIEKGEVLPLGKDRLLVETSCFNPPINFDELLLKIQSKGFFPVLAHPERYMYMDINEYERLKQMGVLFQLNLPALCGAYGASIKRKAEKILDMGWYDMYGTDIHRTDNLAVLKNSTLTDPVVRKLRSIGNE